MSIRDLINGPELRLLCADEAELDVVCTELVQLTLTERLKITQLDLSEGTATPTHLDIIIGCLPALNDFNFAGCRIEGQSWLRLLPQRTIRLELDETILDHQGLIDFLPSLPHLNYLGLGGLVLQGTEWPRVLSCNISELDLNCATLDLVLVLRGLAWQLPRLKKLKLEGCVTELSGELLDPVAASMFCELTELNLCYIPARVDNNWLDKFFALLPLLTRLDLYGTKGFIGHPGGSSWLARLQLLQRLSMARTEPTAQCIQTLALLPNLEELDMSKCRITDRMLQKFYTDFPSLTDLDIAMTGVSQAAYEKLSANRPGLSVHWKPVN